MAEEEGTDPNDPVGSTAQSALSDGVALPLRLQLTCAMREMSFGRQSPVVRPSGVLVAIQPYSSNISAPMRVDDKRPMTKKQVL